MSKVEMRLTKVKILQLCTVYIHIFDHKIIESTSDVKYFWEHHKKSRKLEHFSGKVEMNHHPSPPHRREFLYY